MKNIMLAIETFGTSPFAMIISLGAVYFDPAKQGTDAIKSEFYVTIQPEASEKIGARMDASTICRWLDPARSAAYAEWLNTAHFEPDAAFHGFQQWLLGLFDINQYADAHDDIDLPADPAKRETFEPLSKIVMWGNGPAFDNEIVRNNYKMLGMDPPWKHWNDRDFRTMKNLTMGEQTGGTKAKDLAPPHEGHQHNALIDARQQAMWLCNIVQQFSLTI